MLQVNVDIDLSGPWHRGGPVYGDHRLTPQRLGQRAFQAVVLGAYERGCAVTGDKIRPVLQAAHIRPLPAGGEHRLDNGLLLRSDVHALYDSGYLECLIGRAGDLQSCGGQRFSTSAVAALTTCRPK